MEGETFKEGGDENSFPEVPQVPEAPKVAIPSEVEQPTPEAEAPFDYETEKAEILKQYEERMAKYFRVKEKIFTDAIEKDNGEGFYTAEEAFSVVSRGVGWNEDVNRSAISGCFERKKAGNTR